MKKKSKDSDIDYSVALTPSEQITALAEFINRTRQIRGVPIKAGTFCQFRFEGNVLVFEWTDKDDELDDILGVSP